MKPGELSRYRPVVVLATMFTIAALLVPTASTAQQDACSDLAQSVSKLVVLPSGAPVSRDQLKNKLEVPSSVGLNSGDLKRDEAGAFWTGLTRGGATPVQDIVVKFEPGEEVCSKGSCVTQINELESVPTIAIDEWTNSGECVALLRVPIDAATYLSVRPQEANGRLTTEVFWSPAGGWLVVNEASGDRTLALPDVRVTRPLEAAIPESAQDGVAIVIQIDRGGSDRDTLKFLSQPLAAFPGKTPLTAKDVTQQVCSNQNKLCQCVKASRFLRFSCFTQAQRLDFKELVIEAGPKQ